MPKMPTREPIEPDKIKPTYFDEQFRGELRKCNRCERDATWPNGLYQDVPGRGKSWFCPEHAPQPTAPGVKTVTKADSDVTNEVTTAQTIPTPDLVNIDGKKQTNSAQAGEACKTCGGTGEVWRSPGVWMPESERKDWAKKPCPDCLGTGKVPAPVNETANPVDITKADVNKPAPPTVIGSLGGREVIGIVGEPETYEVAPPTPSAGEATLPDEMALEPNEAFDMLYKRIKPASPQLPTPEHQHGILCETVMKIRNTTIDEGVMLLENMLAGWEANYDALQAKAADERFEEAIGNLNERNQDIARRGWYEGGTR